MSLQAYFKAADKAAPENAASRYSDLVLVAGIIAIVAMMILPLPALAIDTLVAVNITAGVILLLVAIYINSPVEFSVFPSVLLISTLFRLSLSIATTRMILLEGHAGHIIDTFGKVVAGGNLVVGLVVFLIITVVQFIVIAKGAERVAEVAARFSLDAMPGKQLSIDSDLRSGLIDKDEARRKRRMLELESKLHGSLDGAMKFVKGDAICGIVIIVINLLGGLTVGVLQQGMDLTSAVVKYSILTIGDGMVMQIPALFGAMAAGLIVTRTTDEVEDKHLGDSIRKQLSARPRVLLVAGGICVLMALVPGFPWMVFVCLAFALLFMGAMLTPTMRDWMGVHAQPVRKWAGKPKVRPTLVSTSISKTQPIVPLLLEIHGAESRLLDPVELARGLDGVIQDFQQRLGLSLPRIAIHFDPESAEDRWQLLGFEVPFADGPMNDMSPDRFAHAVTQALRRNAAQFVGTQETSALLSRASDEYPDTVKEALRAVPILRMAEIFRRLVEEEVPLRNTRDLLEAMADAGQREKDVFALTEFARMALKRYLSHRFAPSGSLRALLLAPELEEQLRQSVRVIGGAQQLSIDPVQAKQVIDAIRIQSSQHHVYVLLTTVDVRRHIRKLIEPDLFDVNVLSYHELVSNLKLDVVARVGDTAVAAPKISSEPAK
jgi:type III secretion protein V